MKFCIQYQKKIFRSPLSLTGVTKSPLFNPACAIVYTAWLKFESVHALMVVPDR